MFGLVVADWVVQQRATVPLYEMTSSKATENLMCRLRLMVMSVGLILIEIFVLVWRQEK